MRFVTCTCTAALSALFAYSAQAQLVANRDLLRISNLNTEWSVIDTRLVEHQRYGL